MDFYDYIITGLVLSGAIIILLSARYTQKIFRLLSDNNLQSNWKKLRVLMLIFFVGYIGVALVVVLGKTELLAILSGAIFFMGSLFVFLVVSTGLDSFTKLKQLHQNLDDTELKNEELEQFAYITSHDLKAPLRGISSLATFIKEDLQAGKTEDVYKHLDFMQGRIERLESLITGILHYSRIGNIKKESVNLHEIVIDELEEYQNNTNLNCTVKNQLPVVKGDRLQLSQVVANLISNAVKYNDKPVCELVISSIETNDKYFITFQDNGPGIDPKYHQKIFEVFQTLNDRDTYESTGIGLSIVKKIVEKHEGNVEVISDGKLGTKFVMSCPK
ncbi:sensor histidine kinase [Ochrovirga pacifica]|uniref:sensor histidine kinase n=1 Tax=Ochrovirga pacifica TaxID=1042376 RepID=UPI0002558B2C|nr:ATP-binding protein [Ochrovirga pacifica]